MSTNLPKINYLTIRETAFVLGVSRGYVSRAIRVGVIRAVRRPSSLAVPSSEITKWLGGAG